MSTISSFSFVGGGRITWLLLESLNREGALPSKITVSDPNPDARRKIESIAGSIACTSDNAAAARSDVVFLAVHPPALKQVASQIASHLSGETVVVSLAPKARRMNRAEWLGGVDGWSE